MKQNVNFQITEKNVEKGTLQSVYGYLIKRTIYDISIWSQFTVFKSISVT